MDSTLGALGGRDLITLLEYSKEELLLLVERARGYRSRKISDHPLEDKTVALLFEKPSTRTRVSMSVAIAELGGFPLVLPSEGLQVSRGESLMDTALVLSRYVHGVAARVRSHSTLEELAKWSNVPIINMLSDLFHPLQALADVMTMMERFGTDELRLAFVGDGGANTNHSLMIACALLGYNYVVSSPKDYGPDPRIVDKAEGVATPGWTIEMVEDPKEAVRDVDVIYTDTWASMGVKDMEKRTQVFPPYQVNGELLEAAGTRAIVLHCQPWFIGQEIARDVAYGPRSLAFEQAENRLHSAKSVVSALLGRQLRA